MSTRVQSDVHTRADTALLRAGVADTYCAQVQPSWPICDRSPLRSEGPPRRPTSSVAAQPAASNRNRVAKFPLTGTEINFPPAFGSAGSTSTNGDDSSDWFDDDDDSTGNAAKASPGRNAQSPASVGSTGRNGADYASSAPSSPGSTSPSMSSDYSSRRPSGPPMISKLDELRLSPDWDVHAAPQTREYWWTIAEHPGAPDGCAYPFLRSRPSTSLTLLSLFAQTCVPCSSRLDCRLYQLTYSRFVRRLLVNGQFPGPLIEANNGGSTFSLLHLP